MSLTEFSKLAAEGRCIICRRRLPKVRIALYSASAPQGVETEDGLVQVSVCNDRCLEAYNEEPVRL